MLYYQKSKPNLGSDRGVSKLIVEIPEEISQALRLPPAEQERELRRELAVALYQRGVLGFGKARRLAGASHWEFDQLLGERKIVRHYDDDDLRDDLLYAQGR